MGAGYCFELCLYIGCGSVSGIGTCLGCPESHHRRLQHSPTALSTKEGPSDDRHPGDLLLPKAVSSKNCLYQEIYCGEEVVNDFGKLSSSELLRRYGFVERERPVLYNRAEISLHDLIRVISFLKNDEGEIWKAKIRWLKKRGWIPEDGWFHMDTHSHPPSHISSTIAVLWMTDATWQKSLSRSKYNRKRVPCPSRMKWKEIISCIARYKIEKLKHGEQLKPHGVENPQIRVADHIRKDEMHVWRSFLHTIESDRAETDPTRHRLKERR